MNRNQLQTPCYVIHQEELKQGIDLLKESLQNYWNNYIIGYSFKTNSLPFLVEEMKKYGFYAEVVSEDEYNLAKSFGYTNIIYNGPVKGKESFFDALSIGAIINLDAKRELRWLKEWLESWDVSKEIKFKIGLRVNFNLEEMTPEETSAGEEGSRFGFSYETGELKDAIEELKKLGIKLSGLHLHVSSKTRSVAIYRSLAKKVCKIKEKYGLELEYIDIGGGYFGGMKNKPQFPDYVEAIREELLASFLPENTVLIMEPGTSIITPPIEFISTVVDVRDTYANRIVTLDGSRIDIDPLHSKSSYFYHIEYTSQEEEKDSRKDKNFSQETVERKVREKQIICGLTCMENDRLFSLENQKELKEGDRISFQKVGGYTMCLTPLFIRYLPRVYVENKGDCQLVRRAWSEKEYCGGQVLK